MLSSPSKRTVIIAGSNHQNMKLAETFKGEIDRMGGQATIIDVVALDLPLYTPITEKKNRPAVLADIAKTCDEAGQFVVLTPEYNGGVAPALTNLIAWLSRNESADFRQLFNGKSAAIGSASGGGGMHALVSLRIQLSYLGLNVVGREIVVNSSKPLNVDSVAVVVKTLCQ